jgi:DNA-directed RNA polymerase subunit RPC12/RpoP
MVSGFVCAIWGHAVDNGSFLASGRVCTRCGTRFLRDDERSVRVGHMLGCFLRHHTYEHVGERHGHNEYACIRCGHPLLFRVDSDPYDLRGRFEKRVRYLCGLLGHRVHEVTVRHTGTEYACECGHTFVRQRRGRAVVHHPAACVLLGHWIEFVDARWGFSEYACRRCGHPFLFAGRRSIERQPSRGATLATVRPRGRSTLKRDEIAERGARRARRDDREYARHG